MFQSCLVPRLVVYKCRQLPSSCFQLSENYCAAAAAAADCGGDGSGARSEYRYNATETLGIINIARVIASADIRTIIMCPSSDARAASSYKTIFKT